MCLHGKEPFLGNPKAKKCDQPSYKRKQAKRRKITETRSRFVKKSRYTLPNRINFTPVYLFKKLSKNSLILASGRAENIIGVSSTTLTRTALQEGNQLLRTNSCNQVSSKEHKRIKKYVGRIILFPRSDQPSKAHTEQGVKKNYLYHIYITI